jgi:uncharacterized protein YabE (DUF348 family)
METKKNLSKIRLSPWKILAIVIGAMLLALLLFYILGILATELL